MPHATRENLKKEIYFDENASDFDSFSLSLSFIYD